MICRELRKNKWMGMELSAKQLTMDDNVAGFGLSVMANDCHIACKQTVFSEALMNGLTGEVVIGFVRQFNGACSAEERAINAWVTARMDVPTALAISRATPEESMPFQHHRFVVIQSCFWTNWARMKL